MGVSVTAESAGGSGGGARSRQKNCNHCVLIKRRCDRRMPTCSRCADANVKCVYSAAKTAGRPVEEQREPPEARPVADVVRSPPFGSDSSLAPGFSHEVNYLDMMNMDAHFEAGGPSTTSETIHSQPLSGLVDADMQMDSFLDLISHDNSDAQHRQTLQLQQTGSLVERPTSPAEYEIMRSYEKFSDFCDDIEPWHLGDPTSRLYYLVNRVKGFVTDVATRNAAPFLHRRLYRGYTPPCIVSCFAASLLYTSRTPDNTPMVLRSLHDSIRELVDAEAARLAPATPVEKLARAQALFLYQIIRLLDGDVMLRARGQRDIPLLKSWLADLFRVRENLGDLTKLESSAMRDHPPMNWETWIFAESVRRTIVMAFSFIVLYEQMTEGDDWVDDGTWAYSHRWTLSKHLWEADSPFEFNRKWKEKPHFVITNYTFEHFLQYGRGEDVDEFAQILLTITMGMDEANEFMSGQGKGITVASY